jgi:beta-N-acetylhexosaminidase
MSRSAPAAGMILGGMGEVTLLDSDSAIDSLVGEYAEAGIRAFLVPGSLLRNPERLSALAASARKAAEAAGLGRALVAIGGRSQPSFGFPPFPLSPTPLGLASLESPKAAKRAGFLLGSRLAECGVDMVLAPRLDLASDPKDPEGALEGFGEDSRLAGLLGASYARGLERGGVEACVGRFPGLGAVCRDGYESMAFVTLPVERLERCEMRPFARVVASGVAAVLVGRVLVPALESEHIPASASARIIEGRLRESMGFRGLVIGDDIGLGEDPGKSAVLSILAGCDMCLFSRPAEALAAAAALEKAAAAGELPAIRIEIVRRRIAALLARRPARLFHAGRAVRLLRAGQASGAARAGARRIERAQQDIEDGVSDLRGVLAFDESGKSDRSGNFVLVFLPPEGSADASESEAVLAELRAGLPGAEIRAMPAQPGRAAAEELTQALSPRGRYSEAAILTYDAHFRPAQEGLARLVEEFIPRFRVIAMRDPYDAAFFPSAEGLGAAFGFSGGSARAVARLLSGKAKAHGGRPVEVVGLEI